MGFSDERAAKVLDALKVRAMKLGDYPAVYHTAHWYDNRDDLTQRGIVSNKSRDYRDAVMDANSIDFLFRRLAWLDRYVAIEMALEFRSRIERFPDIEKDG